MNSKFWWTLRDLWHAPSWHRHQMWEFSFYSPDGKWDFGYAMRVYCVCPRYLRRDVVNVFRYLWWYFWWLQPLRCNGNGGGWRTRFCNWLEDRARQAEDTHLGNEDD